MQLGKGPRLDSKTKLACGRQPCDLDLWLARLPLP